MQYWYELFLDDLPMWGMVGETLRDDTHERMEKVSLKIDLTHLSWLYSTYLLTEVLVLPLTTIKLLKPI